MQMQATTLGHLLPKRIKKVQAYIQSAEQQGAKLWSMAAMQNRQAMKKVSLLDQL